MINSKKPFFSVVIPVFNKELYVYRAVSSVLNQTFQDFELIIVCDPSTDKSLEQIYKFSDQRILIFHRDEPGPGGYAARNLGINKAKGHWISFLDADDEWGLNNLEKLYLVIKDNPNTKLVTSMRLEKNDDVTKLDEFSNQKGDSVIVFDFKYYVSECLEGRRAFNSNSVVFNRDFFDGMFFFPVGRTNRSGDLYLWVVLMARAKKAVWSPHVGSISYRNIIGVSQTAVPSMSLNHEMFRELEVYLDEKESLLLKKYANRLIRTAYFEQRRLVDQAEMRLVNAFYWRSDFKFCLFWSIFSFLPQPLIELIKKVRRKLK